MSDAREEQASEPAPPIEQPAERGEDRNIEAGGNGAQQEAAGRSVKKGALAVLLAIVLSLLWYLFADRFTPYTTQARVEGFVIGVAPQVSGRVTKVWVINNQEVQEDDPLFEIDNSHYQIALNKARSD